ncbi:uncharacterized protein METZ01_LOCUS420146, partial [marine metagenome]
LGSFLSGGIDSSLITALMQANASEPVRTFSIGFEDSAFNEAEHAAIIAAHLGTNHTEYRLTEADALAVIPDLPHIYDEPFADSSQIPTLLLCRLARQEVTVALTGDGGDEVFGGYNRYLFVPEAWRQASRLPKLLRSQLGKVARIMHLLGGTRNFLLRSAIRRVGLPVSTLEKISSLGNVLGVSDTMRDLYVGLTRTFVQPELFLQDKTESSYNNNPDLDTIQDLLGPAEWMMAMDSLSYLPGDILVKVDRAAMSVSLETRAPFLDSRIVEA